jgi:hypothetical protein
VILKVASMLTPESARRQVKDIKNTHLKITGNGPPGAFLALTWRFWISALSTGSRGRCLSLMLASRLGDRQLQAYSR